MGYSPWGHKKSDRTEHTQTNIKIFKFYIFEPRQVQFKVHVEGSPVGPVVKNLPCNAKDTRSRKIPQTSDQLSPCATTTKPVL